MTVYFSAPGVVRQDSTLWLSLPVLFRCGAARRAAAAGATARETDTRQAGLVSRHHAPVSTFPSVLPAVGLTQNLQRCLLRPWQGRQLSLSNEPAVSLRRTPASTYGCTAAIYSEVRSFFVGHAL